MHAFNRHGRVRNGCAIPVLLDKVYKFVAEVKGTPVGAQTVVCVKGVNGLNVETNFVMWQLAGKTIEEYTNDIATELQKETRRKYIDSYKIQ